MFTCKTCKLELPSDQYYFNQHGGRNHACKTCIKNKNKELYQTGEYKEHRRLRNEKYLSDPKNAEKNRKRSVEHYQSVRGRALSLFNSAKNRAKKYDEKMDIDLDFILQKLNLGVCDVTGVHFDFGEPVDTMKNPYAPSVDRRDSNVGYTKENTQIVIWQYNLMKGEISESELLHLCQILIERSKNG